MEKGHIDEYAQHNDNTAFTMILKKSQTAPLGTVWDFNDGDLPRIVFPVTPALKAPLCKGGCHASSVTGGLFQQADYIGSISKIDNPSVKNQINF